MPELPDVTIYVERLQAFVAGKPIRSAHVLSPFVLRTVEPRLTECVGKPVDEVHRIGKRIVLRVGDVFLVFHLMIAGRFHWRTPTARPNKTTLAVFGFDHGALHFTEAGSKKRASLHIVRGQDALAEFDRGGLEPIGSKFAAFRHAMTRENHTLKRALTDPTILSGVGNAYSDEILHHAKMSPFVQTQRMDEDQLRRLHASTQEVLQEWIERTRKEVGDAFPEKVTAFRDGMAVHGRFGKACPVCATPVQKIAYADNECNYCPTCQTDGRLLADRGLSRLLKSDWPKTLEEMELRRQRLSDGRL